ncbi:MAG: hypothetical protein WBA83_02345 [Burkholderiaceae bacterium]
MKINKTEKSNAAKSGAVRAKLPAKPEIQTDDRGKLAVQITAWAPDGKGNAVQHQVVLTDGDIERLLSSLANPQDPDTARVVGRFMEQNLKSLLRLSALGAGTTTLL